MASTRRPSPTRVSPNRETRTIRAHREGECWHSVVDCRSRSHHRALLWLALSDSCSVCDHVIAEHYYSFRVTKKEVELAVQVDPSSSSSAPASGDASAAGQSAMVVTHDYLMECVLCGKGADEQVHHHHHHHHRHHAGSSPAALPPVAGPPISLAAIQLQNVPPPTTTTMDAKEEEEWA